MTDEPTCLYCALPLGLHEPDDLAACMAARDLEELRRMRAEVQRLCELAGSLLDRLERWGDSDGGDAQ